MELVEGGGNRKKYRKGKNKQRQIKIRKSRQTKRQTNRQKQQQQQKKPTTARTTRTTTKNN